MIGCNERGEEIKIIYHNEIKPNVEYRGKLIMKHDLDSIKLKKGDVRATSLRLVQSKKRRSIEYYEKIKDSMPMFGKVSKLKDNDTIYFYYEFEKEGVYYLDGMIDDTVLLKDYYEDGSSRLLNDYTKISQKVTVTK